MSYTTEIRNKMIGKTIEQVFLDGYGILIVFTDGTEFNFDGSDGGCSTYELNEKKGE